MMTNVQLFNILDSVKQVRAIPTPVERDFPCYIHTINVINNLDEGVTSYNGVPLDDYKIIPVLADLINPEKVSIDGKDMAIDLIDRNVDTITIVKGDATDRIMSSIEFSQFSDALNSILRKRDDLISVKSLRQRVIINEDILRRSAFEGNCILDMNYFMPLQLVYTFYSELAYTYDCCDMQHKYLTNKFKVYIG